MEARLRKGVLSDAVAVHDLVKRSTLDDNSRYFYLMMFSYFADSSVVAEARGKIVGFVCGFVPPEDSKSYFCWQVGVDESARGQGLAGKMLDFAVDERFSALQATVTPSNDASTSLFKSFARKRGWDLKISPYFNKELFSGVGSHEEERLFDIRQR